MPEERKLKRGHYKSEDDKDDSLLARMHNENPDQIGFCGDYRKIEEQEEHKKNRKLEKIVLGIKYIRKAKEKLGEDATPKEIKRLAYFYYLSDKLDELVKKYEQDEKS